MKKYQVIILVFLVLSSQCLDLPSFYHNTQSINQELEQISSQCSFIQLSDASVEPLIKQVDINSGSAKRYRGYLLFGEHPRELISPETGLGFIKNLCQKSYEPEYKKILDNFELRMIVNANPLSREKVEAGQFCVRENERGVDLNRNYDAHWEQIQDDYRQVSSGPSPFSEPETQAIRDSLKSFNADLFLSVHSGTLGMYTPHAYSTQDAEVNDDKMIDILDKLQNNYCPSCDVGAAGKEVGYLSPGSCIDYAYDELGIKYSFAFEIYHQNVDLSREILENQEQQSQISFLQVQETVQERRQRKLKKLSKVEKNQSCFLQTSSQSQQGMSDADCFHYFNPQNEDDYSWYVENWSRAMTDMLSSMVDEELQATPSQKKEGDVSLAQASVWFS